MVHSSPNPLPPESDSLAPLPQSLRTGLGIVSVIASFSLVSSTVLFLHLSFKLARWHLRHQKSNATDGWTHQPFDGTQIIESRPEAHFAIPHPDQCRHDDCNSVQKVKTEKVTREPNQFIVLLHNLLLADMHQSIAFFLNIVWVGADGILVRTGTCWVQGWFVSTGDLSASLFIVAIATHTYGSIVHGYKPPRWILFSVCIGIWVFTYVMAVIGLLATENGRSDGGFYVRAAAWCWVNEAYETLRLVTHYLFIFASLVITSVLYTLIFLFLRRPSLRTTSQATGAHPETDSGDRLAGHHPTFLIYPVVYVLCTLPLALGRIATMLGAIVPLEYFLAAGALITSNGWLDALLWGSTRRTLVFGDLDDDDTGLDSFTFTTSIRTPPEREYGNMIWVQGPDPTARAGEKRRSLWARVSKTREAESRDPLHPGTQGDGSFGIKMDLTTTVVIEDQRSSEVQ